MWSIIDYRDLGRCYWKSLFNYEQNLNEGGQWSRKIDKNIKPKK